MFTRGLSIAILLAALTAYASAAAAIRRNPSSGKVGASPVLWSMGSRSSFSVASYAIQAPPAWTTMKPIWPRMAADKLNTLLAPVSWELIEPAGRQIRFLPRRWDDRCRPGKSPPPCVPVVWKLEEWRVCLCSRMGKVGPEAVSSRSGPAGRNLEILSAFSNANRDADAHAFAALMKHIREVDGSKHTVLMMQVENESGVLGSPRDYSPEAEQPGRILCRTRCFLSSRKIRSRCSRSYWRRGGRRASGATGHGQRSSALRKERTKYLRLGSIPSTSTRWQQQAKRNIPSRCT